MKPLLVIPVKRFEAAKSRLSSILRPSEKQKLIEAMLLDVLNAVNEAKTEFDVAVIAQNVDEVQRTLDEINISKTLWLLEDKENTLNTSIASVAKGAAKIFYSCVLVIHDDLPLLKPKDIDYILNITKQKARCVILAPSRTKGTNLLLLKPPDVLTPNYGPNSFEKHKSQAIKEGIEVIEYTSETTDLDIDDVSDLCMFLKRKPKKTQTFTFLKSLPYNFCSMGKERAH